MFSQEKSSIARVKKKKIDKTAYTRYALWYERKNEVLLKLANCVQKKKQNQQCISSMDFVQKGTVWKLSEQINIAKPRLWVLVSVQKLNELSNSIGHDLIFTD